MADYYVDGTRPDDTGAGTSEATAKKTIAAGVALAVAAGDIVNIKASTTYTQTVTVTLGVASIIIRGYTSALNDGGRPLITCATNSVHLFTFTGLIHYVRFQDLRISHTAGTRGRGITAETTTGNNHGITIINCSFDGCSEGVYGNFAITFTFVDLALENCEVKNCTNVGVTNTGGGYFFGCQIHDNTSHGIDTGTHVGGATGTTPRIVATRCLIHDNGGKGIYQRTDTADAVTLRVINCTITGNTGDGIATAQAGTNPLYLTLENNIIQGNGGWGVNAARAANSLLTRNNAYRSNTSGNLSNVSSTTTDVTLSGDPFTNTAADDYSLDNVAGEGGACRAAGFPGAFQGATTTGYVDIGAAQHADPVTSGGIRLAGHGGFAA